MKTKKIAFSVLLFLLANTAFSQMSFSYDASGNRIKSKLVITQVSQSHSQTPTNTKEKELTRQNMDVYPNPTSSAITIDVKEAASYKATLYDLSGKVIKEETFSDLRKEIDLSAYQSALYFLDITSNGKTVKWKILKQ